jgi:hypothetical protein
MLMLRCIKRDIAPSQSSATERKIMSNAVTPQRGSRSSDMGDTPQGRQKHEKCLVSGSPSWEQCLDRSPGQRSRPRVLAPWRQQKAYRVPFARLGSASAPASRLRSNQGRGPLAPGSYSRYRPSTCHSFIDCTALHCKAKVDHHHWRREGAWLLHASLP